MIQNYNNLNHHLLIYININIKSTKLSHISHNFHIQIMLRILSAPNIRRIKGIRSIAAMLQQEHGFPTCQRTREETQPFHVPDAVASRPRFGRVSSLIRSYHVPEADASRPRGTERHRPRIGKFSC